MSDAALQLDGLQDEAEDPRMPSLRRFAAGQKITAKEQSILMAHSLIYDPHVDGLLRLAPEGRRLLGEEGT